MSLFKPRRGSRNSVTLLQHSIPGIGTTQVDFTLSLSPEEYIRHIEAQANAFLDKADLTAADGAYLDNQIAAELALAEHRDLNGQHLEHLRVIPEIRQEKQAALTADQRDRARWADYVTQLEQELAKLEQEAAND